MATQDQPRGSREAYERLSDPAMYWTQVNAQPIREPIRREPPQEEQPDQYHRLPENHPYRELSPDWQPEEDPEATRLASLLPYDDEPQAYDEQHTDSYRADTYQTDPRRAEPYPDEGRAQEPYDDEDLEAHEQFGGVNWGAGFFGWLVAVSFTLFLGAVLGAVVTVLHRMVPTVATMTDTRPGATAVALAAGAVVVLMVGYYAGGYVAGRMSRFDGGRQGAGVWVTGLLMSAVVLGLGLFFGSEYHLFSRVDLPSLPVPGASLGLAGLVGSVSALVGSLLTAIWGGKVGCRYHEKVDEYL